MLTNMIIDIIMVIFILIKGGEAESRLSSLVIRPQLWHRIAPGDDILILILLFQTENRKQKTENKKQKTQTSGPNFDTESPHVKKSSSSSFSILCHHQFFLHNCLLSSFTLIFCHCHIFTLINLSNCHHQFQLDNPGCHWCCRADSLSHMQSFWQNQ